jgi:hypothetical protein
VRRRESEPTDNVVKPVRCRLANVARGSGSADFKHVADLPHNDNRPAKMDNPTQFYVYLGAQLLIGIIGIYYQRQQLRHMRPQIGTEPQAASAINRHWPLLIMVFCGLMGFARKSVSAGAKIPH